MTLPYIDKGAGRANYQAEGIAHFIYVSCFMKQTA